MAIKKSVFEFLANEIMMGIGVFSLPDLKCLFLNKLAHEYLAIPIEADLLQVDLSSFYPATGRDRFRPFSASFLELEGLSQDIIVQRTDKTIFIADVGIRTVTDGQEKFLMVMWRDVTLQKKLQRDLTAKQEEIQKAFQEILEQNKALKDLDRAKDKFIALTTHELRTPLSAMIATSEVLALKLYDTDQQRDDFIKTIYNEGLHLLEIVNDILDFSKIQAGKMDFFVSEQDVKAIVEPLVNNYTQMAEAKSVTLKLEIHTSSLTAYLDPLRFKQCFTNVLNNAIKFTKENTTVTISIRDTGKQVICDIKDQGVGIAAENISKVFNEFETVGNVNTHHKGTGLGMPITKKLMEQMGGQILLETEYGKGAQFSLCVPKEKVLPEELYRSRPSDLDDLAA